MTKRKPTYISRAGSHTHTHMCVCVCIQFAKGPFFLLANLDDVLQKKLCLVYRGFSKNGGSQKQCVSILQLEE